jgi:hypothetical protein
MRLIKFATILALFLAGNGITNAEQASHSRIAYIQTTDSGNRVVLMEDGQNYSFDIQSDWCYQISPDLQQIAVNNTDRPIALKIYNLKTGVNTLTIDWHPKWHWNCGFDWQDNQSLTVWTEVPPENDTVYQIALENQTVTGPEAYEPFYPPNFTDDFVASLSWKKFAYNYCEDVNYDSFPARCLEGDRFVIYDAERQHILADLDDTMFLPPRPLPLALFYAWSPSGRYLAYFGNRQLLNIYDTQQNTLINTNFAKTANTDTGISFGGRPLGIIWSPNDDKVALGVTGTKPYPDRTGYEELDGAGIIDLQSHTFTFLELTRANWPNGSYNWAWAADGESMYIIRASNELIQVDLVGNIRSIAENVTAIYAYFAVD